MTLISGEIVLQASSYILRWLASSIFGPTALRPAATRAAGEVAALASTVPEQRCQCLPRPTGTPAVSPTWRACAGAVYRRRQDRAARANLPHPVQLLSAVGVGPARTGHQRRQARV